MFIPLAICISKECYGFLITYLTAALTELNTIFRMRHLRLVIRALLIDLVGAKIIAL
jgi:hypothetical protein